MTAARQPALFVPHGAPTFALRPGAAGAALGRQALLLPRPRAIVVVSAHWETDVPTVSLASRLDTIHDFSGFPRELYAMRYPATGCPEAAREVAQAITAAGLPVDFDLSRGLDHGAWVPLRLMFRTPTYRSSRCRSSRTPARRTHFASARALAPLRERGFLVIASGNLTHNLRDYFVAAHGDGRTPGYVREFADWMWDRLAAHDVDALVAYRDNAPLATRAHPTEEHLLPLYVALGAGGDEFKASASTRASTTTCWRWTPFPSRPAGGASA